MLEPDLRCLLIGGTSNIGKSTLARAFADTLGWPLVSTDSLGRHPGRPWPAGGRGVPDHVVEHYLGKEPDTLVEENLAHYRAMWPLIERLVRAHAEARMGRLVLEGSGIWPDEVAALAAPHVAAIWLTGSDELIAERIRAESGHADADSKGRALIDRFVARSIGYNARMVARLTALGLPFLTIEGRPDVIELMEQAASNAVRLPS